MTILAALRNSGEFRHDRGGRRPGRAELPGLIRGTLAADRRRTPAAYPADRHLVRLPSAGCRGETGPANSSSL
jgi:hypothetical protein